MSIIHKFQAFPGLKTSMSEVTMTFPDLAKHILKVNSRVFFLSHAWDYKSTSDENMRLPLGSKEK